MIIPSTEQKQQSKGSLSTHTIKLSMHTLHCHQGCRPSQEPNFWGFFEASLAKRSVDTKQLIIVVKTLLITKNQIHELIFLKKDLSFSLRSLNFLDKGKNSEF